MTYYRHKPTVVSAFKWTGEAQADLPEWIGMAITDGRIDLIATSASMPVYAEVHTLEGRMMCNPGDWIVRGVEGELYPVKPSVFNAAYEPVEEFNYANQ